MKLLAHRNEDRYYVDLWGDIFLGISQKLVHVGGKILHMATFWILVDPIRASAVLISIGITITVPSGPGVNLCFILFTRFLYSIRRFYEKDGKVTQTFLEVLADRSFFLKLRRDSLRKGGMEYRKSHAEARGRRKK
jgi:hypothetical protein